MLNHEKIDKNFNIFEYLDDKNNRHLFRTIINLIGTVNKNINKNALKFWLKTIFNLMIFNFGEVLIITEGTDFGLSRLVGEVVVEYFYGNESIKLIGINDEQNCLTQNDLQRILEVR